MKLIFFFLIFIILFYFIIFSFSPFISNRYEFKYPFLHIFHPIMFFIQCLFCLIEVKIIFCTHSIWYRYKPIDIQLGKNTYIFFLTVCSNDIRFTRHLIHLHISLNFLFEYFFNIFGRLLFFHFLIPFF